MQLRAWLVSLFMLATVGFGSAAIADPAPMATSPAAAATGDYRLGVADKVRILIYNEPNLSGEFTVNANGTLAFPLIGEVRASGRTSTEINAEIVKRLSDGYLRDPQVSIDVLTFRPFYILGEVNKPGEYPYETGLTVGKAVATANGYTYRADKKRVFLKRIGEDKETAYPMSADTLVEPGDTIRIGERFF
ncbi:MAG TPA: polysaccharide biosynthesis/export family protein [Caulobacteraceae bacterium]|jgi:polysaccharide export outer membrane protein